MEKADDPVLQFHNPIDLAGSVLSRCASCAVPDRRLHGSKSVCLPEHQRSAAERNPGLFHPGNRALHGKRVPERPDRTEPGGILWADCNSNGTISISNSQNVLLYGLNVTNPGGDGISVFNSGSIGLDVCASNGNAGVGAMSDVTVGASGAFDNNVSGGIRIGDNSLVRVIAWAGPVDISNNGGPGVWASQANFSTFGRTTIANNLFGTGSSSGFGIDLRGGAHAQIGGLFGPHVISGNQSGGAWLQETAEISFFSIGQPNLIQGNGPVGVLAGFGSQVTFFDISGPLGAQITNHTSAGVDRYANSQAYFNGANQVLRNGTVTNPRSAGIRVDGNSEAFLRGGQVAQNNGPGILALVNSSADFTGVNFAGNAQGEIIACDSSSWIVSDLAQPNRVPPAGVLCKTPHALGNRDISKALPPMPDWSAHKARLDRYAKFAIIQ
jgi:hypothetical protein